MVRTSIILSPSAYTSVSSWGTLTFNSRPFSFILDSKEEATCSIRLFIFTDPFFNSTWPDSILDISRRLLIIRANRSILFLAIERILPCFLFILPGILSRTRLMPSLVIERGVLNSCETVEINSVFIRSTSFSAVISLIVITRPNFSPWIFLTKDRVVYKIPGFGLLRTISLETSSSAKCVSLLNNFSSPNSWKDRSNCWLVTCLSGLNPSNFLAAGFIMTISP